MLAHEEMRQAVWLNEHPEQEARIELLLKVYLPTFIY
jgi:hypothetical protein